MPGCSSATSRSPSPRSARLPSVSLGWLIAAVSAAGSALAAAADRRRRARGHPADGASPFTPLDFTAYPWSHSLLMALVWSLLYALASIAACAGLPRRLARGRSVVSHWVLDWITHAPDMPLWPTASSPRLGLGLWNSIPATLVVEGRCGSPALALYLRGSPRHEPDRPDRVVVLRAVTTRCGSAVRGRPHRRHRAPSRGSR